MNFIFAVYTLVNVHFVLSSCKSSSAMCFDLLNFCILSVQYILFPLIVLSQKTHSDLLDDDDDELMLNVLRCHLTY